MDVDAGVEYLQAFSNDDLLQVLKTVLPERIEVLQDLCNWAAPDYVYANARCLTDTRFTGLLKSFNAPKRIGFIQSAEITEAFGMDLLVSEKQLKCAAVPGTELNFAILLNKGKPQAFDVNANDSASSTDWGGHVKGGQQVLDYGYGKAGSGVDYGYGKAGPYGKGHATMDWGVGVSYVPAGGKSKASYVPAGGNVVQVGKGYGSSFSKGSKASAKAPAFEEPGPKASKVEVAGVTDQRFYGTVKSRKDMFGFLLCEELQVQFEQDIFVHKTELKNFQAGDAVSFSVIMNEKNGLKAIGLEAA